MKDTRRKEDMQRIRGHAARLAEHFDTVQIVCTRYEQEHSFIRAYGTGNVFARIESCDIWVRSERKQ